MGEPDKYFRSYRAHWPLLLYALINDSQLNGFYILDEVDRSHRIY